MATWGVGDGALIEGCTFDAVVLWCAIGAAGLEIVDCEFHDVLAGNASVITLLADGGSELVARVSGCRFFRCGNGVEEEYPVVGWDHVSQIAGVVSVEASGNLFDECLSPAIGPTGIWVTGRPGSARRAAGNSILIEGNTIARSSGGGLGGSFLQFPPGTQIHRNAITGCESGVLLGDSGGVQATCNNVWGNAAGNWIDGPDLTGVNGNLSVSPFYCAAAADNYTLAANSPMLPANNDCGIQIGAFGQGCGPVSVEPASWGGIKALYRSE